MTIGITRRNFLKGSLGCAGCALLARGIAPDFVYAQTAAASGPPLFIVQMFFSGGMDTVRAFPPAGALAQTYVDISNGLRTANAGGIAEDPSTHIPFSSIASLHPSFSALKPIINAGHLALLHRSSVGLDSPTFGHEAERLTTFNLGRLSSSQLNSRQGWANALLEEASSVCNVWGIGVGNQESMQGPYVGEIPVSVSNLNQYNFVNRNGLLGGTDDSNLARQLGGNVLIAAAPQTDAQVKVQRSVQAARDAVADVQRINSRAVGTFPGGFGNTMASVAKIFLDAATRNVQEHQIVLVERGGFDTHNNQNNTFSTMLNDVGNGVAALYNFMAAKGLLSRFILITGSDFARTTYANTSAGTDHAWGTTNMVISGALRKKEFGDPHTDADLRHKRNYILPTLDTRNAYWDIFAKMGLDPQKVLRYHDFQRRPIGLFS
jgi:uncharacterized protein (DUF1501 family)